MPTTSQLRPWKALKSGMLSQEELFALLEARKIGYTTWAKDLLDRTHFPPFQQERQVNFGRLAIGELGLTTRDGTDKAAAALREMGIDPQHFIPVYAFELAIACAEEQMRGTLVIPLSVFSRYSAMYVSSRSAGFHCSVRADQYPSQLEENDLITFVIPE